MENGFIRKSVFKKHSFPNERNQQLFKYNLKKYEIKPEKKPPQGRKNRRSVNDGCLFRSLPFAEKRQRKPKNLIDF